MATVIAALLDVPTPRQRMAARRRVVEKASASRRKGWRSRKRMRTT